MFNRVQAKENAKTILRQRTFLDVLGFGGILTAFSLFLAIAQIVTIFMSVARGILLVLLATGSLGRFIWPALWCVLILLIYICIFGTVSLLFQAGMVRSALRLARDDPKVRVVDTVLAGDCLGMYIRVALWQFLFRFLWGLPGDAALLLSVLLMRSSGILGVIFGLVLMVAGLGWSVFISINKSCQYYFSYFIAEDNRKMAALDCLRESGRLMVSHKLDLFVTFMSFYGCNLLSLTLLANVFTVPYQYVTYAGIYEQLTGSFHPIPQGDMPWRSNGKNKPLQENVLKASGSVKVISGEFEGTTFPLAAGEELRIGRDPQRANVVVGPASQAISGLHCSIRFEPATGSFFITDHSSNGTYLDNKLIPAGTSIRAYSGTIVRLADGAMVLRLS